MALATSVKTVLLGILKDHSDSRSSEMNLINIISILSKLCPTNSYMLLSTSFVCLPSCAWIIKFCFAQKLRLLLFLKVS